MPIIRGSRNVGAISGSDLAVDIVHTDDSVSIGDGTDLLDLIDVGGVKTIPTKVLSLPVGGALDATLIGGTMRTKITDGVDNVEIDDIAGEKAIKVSVISSVGGGSAPAETDGSNFTAGSSVFTPIGAQYDADGSADLADGKVGTLRATSERSLHVHITGSDAGTGLTDAELRATAVPVSVSGVSTAANQATIIGHVDGIETLIGTSNTALAAIQTAVQTLDNAISGTEMQVDVLTMPTVTVNTHAVTQSGTWNIGSITTLPALAAGTNNIGDVDVLTLPSLPAGTNNIGDVDVLSLPGVAGTAAHDAAVSGNPVRVAGRAMLANGTAVAEDDTVDIACDNQGRQVVTMHVPRDLTTHGTATLTSTSETTLIASGAAGVFHDLTKLVFTNSSSTATRVALKDSTTGTTRLEVALAANGGAVIDFGCVPMCQATAANNWTVTLSGAVTSIYCYAQAIKRIA